MATRISDAIRRWNLDNATQPSQLIEIDGVVYLTAGEVARSLGITRQTLWRWRRDGKVPPGRTNRNGQLLFTVDDLRRMLDHSLAVEPLHQGIENPPSRPKPKIRPTKIPGPWALSALLRKPRLIRPPGASLLRFAEFFYSPKAFKEVLEPTIVDLQAEYAEALSQGRGWKAGWVRLRGYWSFVNAAGLLSAVSLGKKVVKIWKMGG